MYLKAHIIMKQGCFFFRYSLAALMTNWVKKIKDLLFCAYVEIHQVRISWSLTITKVSSVFKEEEGRVGYRMHRCTKLDSTKRRAVLIHDVKGNHAIHAISRHVCVDC